MIKTLDIDCLINKSPYTSQAKKFVNFVDELEINKTADFVKVLITLNLFYSTEQIIKNEKSINDYKKLLNNIISQYKELSYLFCEQNKNIPKGLRNVNFITQNHYGNLFSLFDNNSYYKEPLQLLKNRLIRNNIDISLFKNKKALDMGCGSGRYTLALSRLGFKSVIGCDFSDQNIQTAKNRNNSKIVKYYKENILKTRFKNDSFDFIYSNGVLHHTKNIFSGIKEIHRLLRKNGKCFLYVIEKPGGIHWDTIELLRYLNKNVTSSTALSILRAYKIPENRIFYMLDHIFAPINTRTTQREIEQLIKKSGFTGFERLNK